MPTREELGWAPIQRGVRQTVGDFDREVVFEMGHANTPGTSPATNYGIDGFGIRFLLHGPHGTVQFAWNTGIVPEKVPGRYGDEWRRSSVYASDLGYHADFPAYDGMGSMECIYRESGHCYYDGSSLQADEALDLFFTEGEEAMWKLLESRYTTWVVEAENAPPPPVEPFVQVSKPPLLEIETSPVEAVFADGEDG